MARTNKTGIDYFPRCRIHISTNSRLGSSIEKIRYRAYRNISSAFIKRKDVRDNIFKRDSNRCIICGSEKNLEIDHIISVVSASKNRHSI
ncbi:MAG: HNH endonuclease [Suipraeoptans sp.]